MGVWALLLWDGNEKRELMVYVGIVFGIFGLIAFVRIEKLTKTLKEQGVLEKEYKE